MKALDAKVIQQGELILCVDVPAVSGANGRYRAAGIALIHGNDAIVWGELGNRIPWGAFPERHRRAHPARRNKQKWEALAMFFIVQFDIVPFEYRHVYFSPMVGRSHAG